MSDPAEEITEMLNGLQRGEPRADELLCLVYAELRKLAAAKMAREKPGHTLQATALVHEAWLRLQHGGVPPQWQSRAHFFGAAAEAMRRILVDSARRKQAARHGGGLERVNVDDVEIAGAAKDDELLAVSEALDSLAAADAQKAELVKLRYFVGLTIEEAAGILGIAERTAHRHWSFARAWLYDALRSEPAGGGV